jgi:hypothetical protein
MWFSVVLFRCHDRTRAGHRASCTAARQIPFGDQQIRLPVAFFNGAATLARACQAALSTAS